MLHDVQHVIRPSVSGGPRRNTVTPKARKERLFKSGKPVIRKLELVSGETYSKDVAVLWAAYKAKSFSLPEGFTQEEFVKAIEQYFSQFAQVWIVDDVNKSFSSGRGQVGLVMASNADLIIEAKFGFFKWASKRNILRATAAFLNMITYSGKTGICMVRTDAAQRVLPDHLKDYGLLFYMGQSAQNEYLYSVRGRASR